MTPPPPKPPKSGFKLGGAVVEPDEVDEGGGAEPAKSCENILFILGGAFPVVDGVAVVDVVEVEVDEGGGREPHGLGKGSVFSVPA